MDARRETVFWSPKGVAIAITLAATAALLLLFVWATQRVLVWMMIALFLALALDHVVGFLERWLPRTPAVLVTFFAALLALAAIGFVLVPPLVDEVRTFVQQVPDILDKLSRGRGPLGFLERDYNVVERARSYIEQNGAGRALGLTGPIVSILQSAATVAIGIVSVVFLTLFMLISGPKWREGALRLAPDDQRDLWARIGDGIYKAVGGWVIGAAFLGVIAGGSATIVLLVLGVPYALALGLIVGVLDPVPFVGVTVAGLVVGAVAWASVGWVTALVFVGFMVVYQQVVENHLLVPLVYGKTVELSALGVLVAVLLGGELAGVIGAVAAIPIGGALKSTATEILEWRRERRSGREPAPPQRRTA